MCDTYIYTSKIPKCAVFFSQTRLLLCLKMLLDKTALSRGGYWIRSATKTVLFVTKVISWKVSTILKYISTSDVSGVVNSSLTERHVQMSCTWYWTGNKSVINESSLITKISRILSYPDQKFRLDSENFFLIYRSKTSIKEKISKSANKKPY